MAVQKYTIICSDEPYCHSRRGRAQRIRGRPHSEPFFKKKRAYSGARLASRERPSLIGVSGPNYGATRGLDLTYMSKNKPWLLVFMALGANFKISIFDPPSVSVGGTYNFGLKFSTFLSRIACCSRESTSA